MSNPLKKNVISCPLCLGPVDRFESLLQCRRNPNHMGDLNTFIVTDHSMPNPPPSPAPSPLPWWRSDTIGHDDGSWVCHVFTTNDQLVATIHGSTQALCLFNARRVIDSVNERDEMFRLLRLAEHTIGEDTPTADLKPAELFKLQRALDQIEDFLRRAQGKGGEL